MIIIFVYYFEILGLLLVYYISQYLVAMTDSLAQR